MAGLASVMGGLGKCSVSGGAGGANFRNRVALRPVFCSWDNV